MRRPLLLAAMLAAGCFSEPPMLTAEDDDESSGGLTNPPASTSAGPSSGTGQPGTASSTTDAPTSTSAIADEDSSGSSDTGGESSESSSDESESSSTGAPYDGPYGDCWDGPVQSERGEYLCPPSPCVVSAPDHSACAPMCEGGCEPGPDGAATTCLPELAGDGVPEVCVMSCAGAGGYCPEGLECAESTLVAEGGGEPLWFCMWP